MNQKCHICKRFRPPRMTVEIDGETHHYCHTCWEKQRQKFIADLLRGDQRAMAILDMVLKAAGNEKTQ